MLKDVNLKNKAVFYAHVWGIRIFLWTKPKSPKNLWMENLHVNNNYLYKTSLSSVKPHAQDKRPTCLTAKNVKRTSLITSSSMNLHTLFVLTLNRWSKNKTSKNQLFSMHIPMYTYLALKAFCFSSSALVMRWRFFRWVTICILVLGFPSHLSRIKSAVSWPAA